MNALNPKRTYVRISESKLIEELLSTYEEYCQLLEAIIKRVGADKARLRNDLQTSGLSRISDELISKWSVKIPGCPVLPRPK